VAHAAHHFAEGVGEGEGITGADRSTASWSTPSVSKVVAELASRKPPPLVPSCLMLP